MKSAKHMGFVEKKLFSIENSLIIHINTPQK